MNFDERIERRGTHSVKWDMMESLYGVPQDDGIAMWVADMDFRPPTAFKPLIQHGRCWRLGYYGNDAPYRNAICWWMQERHGWSVDPSWIFTTHGLVNGTGMCVMPLPTLGTVLSYSPRLSRVRTCDCGRGSPSCRMPNAD